MREVSRNDSGNVDLALVEALRFLSQNAQFIAVCSGPKKQLPLSLRRNPLPVKRINWTLLMSHEYLARALVELMQIGKTPSRSNAVLHHAPEAFNRIEVVTTVGRQEMQPKLLVPVGVSVDASFFARWMPLRSATITTSLPVWRKRAIT